MTFPAILLVLIGLASVAAVVATIVTVVRDGYRPVRTDRTRLPGAPVTRPLAADSASGRSEATTAPEAHEPEPALRHTTGDSERAASPRHRAQPGERTGARPMPAAGGVSRGIAPRRAAAGPTRSR